VSHQLAAQAWLLTVTHSRAFWHREPGVFIEQWEFDTYRSATP
jgi:hypothetical protein